MNLLSPNPDNFIIPQDLDKRRHILGNSNKHTVTEDSRIINNKKPCCGAQNILSCT